MLISGGPLRTTWTAAAFVSKLPSPSAVATLRVLVPAASGKNADQLAKPSLELASTPLTVMLVIAVEWAARPRTRIVDASVSDSRGGN